MIKLNAPTSRLLGAIASADYERLTARASVVELVKDVDLVLPQQPIEYCWFPLSGLISIIALDEGGREAEIGLVGNDGVADIGTILGDNVGVMRLLVQIPGTALKVEAAVVRALMSESPAFARLMLAYVRAFSVQIASSAIAFALYPIPQRLARWLLMAADRVGTTDIALTHDALSIMLGVRRAGVTVAVQALVAQGSILTSRGHIAIIDRTTLLRQAGAGYGTAEREYERLTSL